MKEKILELLQTKFEGVDARILGRLAEKLGKDASTEEDAKTAVDGVSFSQVLESYGDARATDAQKTAVANYERKHGLKEGKPVAEHKPAVQEEQKPAEAEEMPSWAKAMMEANKALSEKIAAMEGEKTAASRKSQLAQVLMKAPEKIRQRYEKDFERLSFKDEEDYNGWLGEIKPEIESITADFASKGGVVSRPLAGGSNKGGNEASDLVKARFAERANQAAEIAIQGIPQAVTK